MNGAEHLRVYDLSVPSGWEAAHRHRSYWGTLYTSVVYLEEDLVLLVFRPAPDEAWRGWEAVRLQWIFQDPEDRAV